MNGVGISRQVIKKTTLGYHNPWTHQFKPSECVAIGDGWPYSAPIPCDLHPDCFLARSTFAVFVKGHWKLLTPLTVQGYGWHIDSFTVGGMQKHSTGWTGWDFESYFKLISDNTPIFTVPRLTFKTDDYALNAQTGLNLTVGSNLDLDLYMRCKVGMGSTQLEMHIANFKVSGGFFTTESPPMCEVEILVLDRETGNPLSSATVRIKEGTTVIGEVGTNSQGTALIKNIIRGSYTLEIIKSGFARYAEALEVNYPRTSQTAYMNKGAYEIPWIWIIGGAGALMAVAGIVIVMKKKYPQFLVIK